MPSVEPRVLAIILVADDVLMERAMVWMLQRDVLETFKFGHRSVPNDLDLLLVWDGLKIWMQD